MITGNICEKLINFKTKNIQMTKLFIIGCILIVHTASVGQSTNLLTFEGSKGPGYGKHIVFICGDEEYRSEEGLPMMAEILSRKYGFNCTVLFSIDPLTGTIDPNNQTNIPGLENLEKADLMFMLIRFRELPDEQMKYIDEYVRSGKPIVALRTSTHGFNYKRNLKSPYAKYDFKSKEAGWEDGFGRRILGETWISHHGQHGTEGTRGLINGIAEKEKNAILNGVKDIWCPTDVYEVRELPEGTQVLIYGQSTNGMDSKAPVNLDKSIMPVAWVRTIENENRIKQRVFTTTMGASVDFQSEDLRRLLVNASLWAVGLEKMIPQHGDVETLRPYQPSMFGINKFKKNIHPIDLKN